MLDYRIREVGKAYFLDLVGLGKVDYSQFKKLKSFVIQKVVVGHKNKDEYWVMAIKANGKLVVWKMGDQKWQKLMIGVNCLIMRIFLFTMEEFTLWISWG